MFVFLVFFLYVCVCVLHADIKVLVYSCVVTNNLFRDFIGQHGFMTSGFVFAGQSAKE